MELPASSRPLPYNAALPATPPFVLYGIVPVPVKFAASARAIPPAPFDLFQQVNAMQLAFARDISAGGLGGIGKEGARLDDLFDKFKDCVAPVVLFYGCLFLADDPRLGTITGELASHVLKFVTFMTKGILPLGARTSVDLLRLIDAAAESARKILFEANGVPPAAFSGLLLLAQSAFIGTAGVDIQVDTASLSISIDSRTILAVAPKTSMSLGETLAPLVQHAHAVFGSLHDSLEGAGFGAATSPETNEAVHPQLTSISGAIPRIPQPPQVYVKCKFEVRSFLGDLHPGPVLGTVKVPAKSTTWCRVETWEVDPRKRFAGLSVVDTPISAAQAAFEASLVTALGTPFRDGDGPAFFPATPSKVAQCVSATMLAHVQAANAVRGFTFAEIPASKALAGIKGKTRPGVIFLKTENPLPSAHDVTYITARRDVAFVITLAGMDVTFSNGVLVQDYSYQSLDSLASLVASPGDLSRLKKEVLAVATTTDYVHRQLNFLQPPTGEHPPAPYFVYTRDIAPEEEVTETAVAWDPFLKRAKLPGIVMRVGKTQVIPPLVVRSDFDFKRGSEFQKVTRIPADGMDLEGVVS